MVWNQQDLSIRKDVERGGRLISGVFRRTSWPTVQSGFHDSKTKLQSDDKPLRHLRTVLAKTEQVSLTFGQLVPGVGGKQRHWEHKDTWHDSWNWIYPVGRQTEIELKFTLILESITTRHVWYQRCKHQTQRLNLNLPSSVGKTLRHVVLSTVQQ